MRLVQLWLKDFRCYDTVEFQPSVALTAVTGPNGSGKTSLLEAISWLAEAKSFRGAPDVALVRGGAERAIVRAEVEREGRTRLVEAEIARAGRNRIQVNRQPVPRARALAETLRVTVFSPDDLALVKEGPGRRRALLDALLAAATPRSAAVVSDFERVVRQRNALLKQGVRDAEARATLEVWNDQLVQRGAELARARLRLVERLEGPLAKAYGDLAAATAVPGAATATGAYEADWFGGPVDTTDLGDLADALASALVREERRERDRGLTLVGPHRDEWRLTIGGLEARTAASQGEQRSLALALRLAGHHVVTELAGEPPVLLLDDVFSELDPGRTAALVAHLPPGQAVVTSATDLPGDLPVDATVTVAAHRITGPAPGAR